MSEFPNQTSLTEIITSEGLFSESTRQLFRSVKRTCIIQYPHPLVPNYYSKRGYSLVETKDDKANNITIRPDMLLLIKQLRANGIYIVVFQLPNNNVMPPKVESFPDLVENANIVIGERQIGFGPKWAADFQELVHAGSMEDALGIYSATPFEILFAQTDDQLSYLLTDNLPKDPVFPYHLVSGKYKRRRVTQAPQTDAFLYEMEREVVKNMNLIDPALANKHLDDIRNRNAQLVQKEMSEIQIDLKEFFAIN